MEINPAYILANKAIKPLEPSARMVLKNGYYYPSAATNFMILPRIVLERSYFVDSNLTYYNCLPYISDEANYILVYFNTNAISPHLHYSGPSDEEPIYRYLYGVWVEDCGFFTFRTKADAIATLMTGSLNYVLEEIWSVNSNYLRYFEAYVLSVNFLEDKTYKNEIGTFWTTATRYDTEVKNQNPDYLADFSFSSGGHYSFSMTQNMSTN